MLALLKRGSEVIRPQQIQVTWPLTECQAALLEKLISITLLMVFFCLSKRRAIKKPSVYKARDNVSGGITQ